jgi:hypothetical protein
VKRCSRCGQSKPLEEFAWRRKHKDQRDTYCRPCRAAYKQEHYAANKERYIAKAMRRKDRLAEENIAKLVAFFENHPCVDCGEDDPMVLECDHLGKKNFAIARALRDRSWLEIEAELTLCEVVCANCHRRRTATRGGWLRARAAAGSNAELRDLAKERARRLTSA